MEEQAGSGAQRRQEPPPVSVLLQSQEQLFTLGRFQLTGVALFLSEQLDGFLQVADPLLQSPKIRVASASRW